jgi:hypothetical protein
MAILGSLGKAIGLGKFKSKNIIRGIAEGFNEQLKDSMDKTDENVSRLAQLRLTQALRNQELDDADLRENLATIKDLAKQVGGIETATYLIQENGLSGAKTIAEELVKKKKLAGGTIDIPEYVGIEKASGGTVTALDLAKYVTPSRGIPDISDFGDPGIGIASTLFGYGQGALKKRSAADLAASGIDPEAAVITDIPEIKARGLYEWQIYSTDSAQGQVAFLQTVRNRLIKKANDPNTSATEKKALEVEEAAAHSEQDLMNVQARKEAEIAAGLKLIGPLTKDEIKSYERTIASKIATKYALLDKSNWQDTADQGNQWTGAGLSALAQTEIANATAVLIPEINKASRNGVEPSAISNAIRKAVEQNTTFRYVGLDPADPDDEDPFEFTDPEGNAVRLINDELRDKVGDKVFPGPPPTQPASASGASGASGASSSTSSAVTSSVTNLQQNVIDTINQRKLAYRQAAANPVKQKQVVAKLLRSLTAANAKNPATNQPYTESELEAELSR